MTSPDWCEKQHRLSVISASHDVPFWCLQGWFRRLEHWLTQLGSTVCYSVVCWVWSRIPVSSNGCFLYPSKLFSLDGTEGFSASVSQRTSRELLIRNCDTESSILILTMISVLNDWSIDRYQVAKNTKRWKRTIGTLLISSSRRMKWHCSAIIPRNRKVSICSSG